MFNFLPTSDILLIVFLNLFSERPVIILRIYLWTCVIYLIFLREALWKEPIWVWDSSFAFLEMWLVIEDVDGWSVFIHWGPWVYIVILLRPKLLPIRLCKDFGICTPKSWSDVHIAFGLALVIHLRGLGSIMNLTRQLMVFFKALATLNWKLELVVCYIWWSHRILILIHILSLDFTENFDG